MTSGDEVDNAARQAFVAHALAVLQLEIARANTIEQRAGNVARNNFALIATIIASLAFTLGSTSSDLHVATQLVAGAALIIFAASTGTALIVQGKSRSYRVPDAETLNEISEARWTARESEALVNIYERYVEGVEDLQESQTTRATWLNCAVYAQVAAGVLLVAAVFVELALRVWT